MQHWSGPISTKEGWRALVDVYHCRGCPYRAFRCPQGRHDSDSEGGNDVHGQLFNQQRPSAPEFTAKLEPWKTARFALLSSTAWPLPGHRAGLDPCPEALAALVCNTIDIYRTAHLYRYANGSYEWESFFTLNSISISCFGRVQAHLASVE